MSYQTTPWKELAKKNFNPQATQVHAVRGSSHYDEIEALTKELMRKHFDDITQKMILGLFFSGMR